MFDLFRFDLVPGRWFVAATLLPLVPVVLLLATAIVRNLTRAYRHQPSWAARVYWLLGGDQPLSLGGYISLAAMGLAAACAGIGTGQYFRDLEQLKNSPAEFQDRWEERLEWLRLGPDGGTAAMALHLGYRIDPLSALMIAMVAFVGFWIFLFALGYMRGELAERVPLEHGGHSTDPAAYRRGRFSRFYLYLSLFAFSMFHLVIADNLFQVFVSWELVGVCSFFLIGFYYERPAAGLAANKAFLMNRAGDAGFLVALAILLGTCGTLNFQELFALFQRGRPETMSEELHLLMGLGLFLGCVGKSAQVPLQTWLPDAMEGPTPVSALIHAATMVAAGVYLVGRCYPILDPTVLLVVAYVGLATLFISATAALVSTDIKRVLAFSTCSQLGFMMLALGVGGWTAGLLHLLTHAFFKALLFLAAGSVIHGLHHEQDLRKMGGLRRKMPVTAYTMLIGVLAIAGMPLLAGWYSKDRLLAAALGFAAAEQHWLLYILPLATAGLTAFYMARLWFLAFAGTPRDRHLYDQAHESPAVMTIPLVILALFSIGVAWGWPLWQVEASALGQALQAGEPRWPRHRFDSARQLEHEFHLVAAALALLAAIAGGVWAWHKYGRRAPTPGQLAEPTGLLAERWYFDALYDRLFVRGTMALARGSAGLDKVNPDLATPGRPRATLDGVGNAIGEFAVTLGALLRRGQTGLIRGYVLILLASVAGLIGAFALLTR